MWFLVAALLVLVTAWVLLRRRPPSHIPSSLGARGARVGSLVGRSLVRKAWLRLRQVVATREHRRRLEQQHHLHSAKEAAQVLGQMKGVFMKLGQVVSFANDALPEEAQAALRPLQQGAPPMDFALARGVIEEELGDLGRHFKSVEEEPIAAASIGQVHRARLLDGTRVVLKVQYPGVAAAMESDLSMTAGLAAMVGAVARNLDAKSVVEELAARMREELDYGRELQNQALFARIWEGHPLIRVPRVFPAHSGRRVLCQEYARGLGFYDFLEQSTERERRLAVYVLHDFVFDSMFMHRVFNGDPHPGNYLFQEDGGVTFLDFGCVKRFSSAFVRELQTLSRSICEEDRGAFDAVVKRLQIVLPGRPYDSDLMWRFFGYHAAPFAKDAPFAFTAEWIAEARAVMEQKTLQQMNLPPDILFFNRITFGLNAIFHKLGAADNFHRLYRRYMYEGEQNAPAVARAGVPVPDRFLAVRGPEEAWYGDAGEAQPPKGDAP